MIQRIVFLYTAGVELPSELKSGTDLAVGDLLGEISGRWNTLSVPVPRESLPFLSRQWGALRSGAVPVMFERLAGCPSPSGILRPGDAVVLGDDYAGLAMAKGWNPAILIRHNALHQSYAATPRTGLASAIMLGYHTWLARRFDRWSSRRASAVLAPAGTTELLLKKLVPEARVLPWHPRIPRLPEGPFRSRPGTDLTGVFFANFRYGPNFEALKFLCEELAPAVWEHSGTRFRISGPAAQERSGELNVPGNVEISGFQHDLLEFCRSCDFAILPMFQGEGILLKTLTVMGYGMPIVATPKACAGTGLVDGQSAFISEDLSGMVEAIGKLKDPSLREQIGDRAWNAAEPFSNGSGILDAISSVLDPK